MNARRVAIGGMAFEAVVTAGAPDRQLVYHLRGLDWPFRGELLCGRSGGWPRHDDDDPRDLCQRCEATLFRVVESQGDGADWHDELITYEQAFVRPRPASLELTFWRIQQLFDPRGEPWWLFGRQLARPDALPDYVVNAENGATVHAAGDGSEYRASIRWRMGADGGLAGVWTDLYVLAGDGRGTEWFPATPRHNPLEAMLVETVTDRWRAGILGG